MTILFLGILLLTSALAALACVQYYRFKRRRVGSARRLPKGTLSAMLDESMFGLEMKNQQYGRAGSNVSDVEDSAQGGFHDDEDEEIEVTLAPMHAPRPLHVLTTATSLETSDVDSEHSTIKNRFGGFSKRGTYAKVEVDEDD